VAWRGRVARDGKTQIPDRVTFPLFFNDTLPVSFMKSMLIIDRSEIITTVFSELFERPGWNVDVCSDRQCALERLTGDWPYDAIIAGQLRETSEVELVGMIRGFDHRRTAAVVVVLERAATGNELLSTGADEVLFKPVNPRLLMWAVDRHVNR